MSSPRRLLLSSVTAVTLALAAAGAQAAVTPFFAAQGPKDLTQVTPPPLSAAVQAQISLFRNNITVLGEHEFESGSPNFAYAGGLATLFGNPTVPMVINEGASSPVFDPGKGRYNTTILPLDANGDPQLGRFLEASDDFSYAFSAAITAFSFMGTDFFDFDGTLNFSLLNSGQKVGEGDVETQGSGLNGNLVFFGLTSTAAFDTILFGISQTSTANTDVLGFDSIVVGQVAGPAGVPEPGSLALAGLALLGLAGCRASRRR